MRIVILAIGTLGDVVPYTAVGIGLKQSGHEVSVATHESFRGFVMGRGLGFFSIGYPQELISGDEMLKLVDAGGNFIKWMRELVHLSHAFVDDFLNDCLASCRGADLIIYSPFGWAGYHIAQKMGIPSYMACLQPVSRTRYFPAVWSPSWFRLGSYGNLASHIGVEQVFWHVFRRPINRWREKALGLPTIPFTGPARNPEWQRQPFLYGYSPNVVPRPRDWPEWLHVTGYWFLPPDTTWQPPQELNDFLDSGPPPVYIGFGSVPLRNPDKVKDMVVNALSKAGKRGILQISKAEANRRLSGDLFQVGWVPHDWLFPQMAAIVHHGGAGTTASSLRAGVPTITVPLAWDQPFWGRRVARLGVGPPPIPFHKLTAENLSEAIRVATTSRQMAEHAAALGEKIRAEDGVMHAVEVVSGLS